MKYIAFGVGYTLLLIDAVFKILFHVLITLLRKR